ncbi:MAG: nucleotidyltransferase family protein [Bacteroidota bacterium]
MDRKNKYAILILAAGESKRLGRPKQLVRWKNTTLLNHTITSALATKKTDVMVALGAHHSIILPTLTGNISILKIKNWNEGMGATMSNCFNQFSFEAYQGIIISVCDQPYISEDVFSDLIHRFEMGRKTIIVSKYDNGMGPPTLFSNTYLPKLKILKGDVGAKSLIRQNMTEVDSILFEKGTIDIDQIEDIQKLQS